MKEQRISAIIRMATVTADMISDGYSRQEIAAACEVACQSLRNENPFTQFIDDPADVEAGTDALLDIVGRMLKGMGFEEMDRKRFVREGAPRCPCPMCTERRRRKAQGEAS